MQGAGTGTRSVAGTWQPVAVLGAPALAAGLSGAWDPPAGAASLRPRLSMFSPVAPAAVKESSPREWRELPRLRSRSTSAPAAGEPPQQLSPGSPPHRSVPSRPPAPGTPLSPSPPTAHSSLWAAGRVQPSSQGLWGALPCGCVQGATGLSWGQTAPAQVPCPKKPEWHVSVPGVTPPCMHPGTAAPLATRSSARGDTEGSAGFTSPAWRGPFPPQPPARAERCASPSAAAAVGLRPPSLGRQRGSAGSSPRQGTRGRRSGGVGAWCLSSPRAAVC